MTRLEKFNEIREVFKNELLKTFPEISDRPAAINGLMGSNLLVDCEGLTCPEDGDCEKCQSKNYWAKEYGSSPEIKVGDEVYFTCSSYEYTTSVLMTYVVVCTYLKNGEMYAVCLTPHERWTIDNVKNLCPTGRHFPEIKEVLKKLRH